MENYLDINRELWNNKTDIHFQSDFYNVKEFLAGKNSLNSIELDLLGNINGQHILHLQCHFGMDTISLSRLGAKVTGVDFSEKALVKARNLARQTNSDTRFIHSDIYSLPDILNEKFDIVFTTYGVLGWLPDMKKWANIVHHFLKSGGRLILVEFHPIIWIFSEDFSKIQYDYFNTGAIIEECSGTYTNRDAPICNNSVSWIHPLSDIIGALRKYNLKIDLFSEFDYSPYNCFCNTVEIAKDRYQIKGLEKKIPMIYALQATK